MASKTNSNNIKEPANVSTNSKDSDIASLSHEQFRAIFASELKSLVQSDAVLSDLDIDLLSVEDLDNLIALHHGEGMHLKILRGDDTYLRCVVRRDATLSKLRKHIKMETLKELKMTKGVKKGTFRQSPERISWKHVWKTYGLKFEGNILNDRNVKLIDVGVRNGSTLIFVKLKRKQN